MKNFEDFLNEIEFRFTEDTQLQLPQINMSIKDLQEIKKFVRKGRKRGRKIPDALIKLSQRIVNKMSIPM